MAPHRASRSERAHGPHLAGLDPTMNVLEAIAARRAVRAYTSRVVRESTVHSLLDAAVRAPNAVNEQLWVFSVVQNAHVLKRWSDGAKTILLDRAPADAKTNRHRAMLEDPSFNIFYDATTLVVIGSKERGTYTDADCWLAAENLMLAACDAGLGTCPIGFAIPILNTKDVKEELGFPASGVVVAPIIVGYPSATPSPVPRAEPQIVGWIRS
jgi:nitroreductase